MTGTTDRTPAVPEPSAGGPSRPSPDAREGTSPGEFAGLGLQFALSIIVFLYLGQWLDRKLGSAPWLMIIGVFTGASAAFYSMYRKLMAAQAREEAATAARKAATKKPAVITAGVASAAPPETAPLA